MSDNLKGMAKVARGIISTFNEDSKVLLKVHNCELLLNNAQTHMALIDETGMRFIRFFMVDQPSNNLQAAHDFIKHAKLAYKEKTGADWVPK